MPLNQISNKDQHELQKSDFLLALNKLNGNNVHEINHHIDKLKPEAKKAIQQKTTKEIISVCKLIDGNKDTQRIIKETIKPVNTPARWSHEAYLYGLVSLLILSTWNKEWRKKGVVENVIHNEVSYKELMGVMADKDSEIVDADDVDTDADDVDGEFDDAGTTSPANNGTPDTPTQTPEIQEQKPTLSMDETFGLTAEKLKQYNESISTLKQSDAWRNALNEVNQTMKTAIDTAKQKIDDNRKHSSNPWMHDKQLHDRFANACTILCWWQDCEIDVDNLHVHKDNPDVRLFTTLLKGYAEVYQSFFAWVEKAENTVDSTNTDLKLQLDAMKQSLQPPEDLERVSNHTHTITDKNIVQLLNVWNKNYIRNTEQEVRENSAQSQIRALWWPNILTVVEDLSYLEEKDAVEQVDSLKTASLSESQAVIKNIQDTMQVFTIPWTEQQFYFSSQQLLDKGFITTEWETKLNPEKDQLLREAMMKKELISVSVSNLVGKLYENDRFILVPELKKDYRMLDDAEQQALLTQFVDWSDNPLFDKNVLKYENEWTEAINTHLSNKIKEKDAKKLGDLLARIKTQPELFCNNTAVEKPSKQNSALPFYKLKDAAWNISYIDANDFNKITKEKSVKQRKIDKQNTAEQEALQIDQAELFVQTFNLKDLKESYTITAQWDKITLQNKENKSIKFSVMKDKDSYQLSLAWISSFTVPKDQMHNAVQRSWTLLDAYNTVNTWQAKNRKHRGDHHIDQLNFLKQYAPKLITWTQTFDNNTPAQIPAEKSGLSQKINFWAQWEEENWTLDMFTFTEPKGNKDPFMIIKNNSQEWKAVEESLNDHPQ